MKYSSSLVSLLVTGTLQVFLLLILWSYGKEESATKMMFKFAHTIQTPKSINLKKFINEEVDTLINDAFNTDMLKSDKNKKDSNYNELPVKITKARMNSGNFNKPLAISKQLATSSTLKSLKNAFSNKNLMSIGSNVRQWSLQARSLLKESERIQSKLDYYGARRRELRTWRSALVRRSKRQGRNSHPGKTTARENRLASARTIQRASEGCSDSIHRRNRRRRNSRLSKITLQLPQQQKMPETTLSGSSKQLNSSARAKPM